MELACKWVQSETGINGAQLCTPPRERTTQCKTDMGCHMQLCLAVLQQYLMVFELRHWIAASILFSRIEDFWPAESRKKWWDIDQWRYHVTGVLTPCSLDDHEDGFDWGQSRFMKRGDNRAGLGPLFENSLNS